jgi:hypothetical protein
MGKFDAFLADGVHGYFRHGAEDEFPWSSTAKSVWYAVVTVENGRIHSYGFTAARSQRAKLRELLQTRGETEAMLLGVWTGQYGTHLFVLDIDIALKRLQT